MEGYIFCLDWQKVKGFVRLSFFLRVQDIYISYLIIYKSAHLSYKRIYVTRY